MWQFKKKMIGSSLKNLNEKDIQKKLYGHYHADKTPSHETESESEPGGVETAETANRKEFETTAEVSEKLREKLQNKPTESNPVVSARFLDSIEPSKSPTEKSFSTFKKGKDKNHLWVVGSGILLVCICLVLATTFFVEKARESGRDDQHVVTVKKNRFEIKKQTPVTNRVQEKESVKSTVTPDRNSLRQTDQTQADGEKPTPATNQVAVGEDANDQAKAIDKLTKDPAQESPEKVFSPESQGGKENKKENGNKDLLAASLPKEKIFSIQVCTYRLESDAQKLVDRLQLLKLPAYYEAASGKTESIPKFYVVYLGKDTTYSEAQGRLSQFRKLPASKEFSDAYIRRL